MTEPQPSSGPLQITIDTRQLLWLLLSSLLAIELLLVFLDLYVNWGKAADSPAIRRMFNTTREDGLASWFAVTQTFVVAMVLWAIFALSARVQDNRLQRFGWLLLALFFSYMTIDDGAMVHERLGTASKNLGEDSLISQYTGAFPSYAWQALFLLPLTCIGMFMLWFLWRTMPDKVSRIGIIAALGLFAIAVGMDYIEGLEHGYTPLADAFGWKGSSVRHFAKSIEEFLEMLAMSLWLVIFLRYFARRAREFCIHFR
jgi:hypothetical protein